MVKADEKLSIGLVFDDTLDSNDGVSQQVKRLGEFLSKNGHKVVYLCGETKMQEWSGGKVYSLSKNIKIKFNGNRLSMPIFSRRKFIAKVLDDEKLDVIHVTMPYSPLMGQRVISAASKRRVAIVASFHILPSGRLSSFGSRLLGLLQRRNLKKVNEFSATSKRAAEFARKTIGITSSVVPNMVDVRKFLPGRELPNISGRIVFLGRLVQRKGCRQLIEAFALVVQKLSSTELLIAGDGPDRQKLKALSKSLGLSDKIKFLGFITEAEKPKLLGSAQVACFPALYGESFGVVLIEAMAAGAGVVLAGDNPGYSSVVDRPELLVNPKDRQAFSEKLEYLLGSQAERDKLHEWQTHHVKQYDVNVVGAQMLDLYKRAIAKKQALIDN